MSATASSHLNANSLKSSMAQVKSHGTSSTSAMKRVDALQVGDSNGALTLRFFVVLGFGALVFAFAQFLGII